MSRFQEKLAVVKDARAKVKELRRQVQSQNLNFQCREPETIQHQIVNEDFFGSHHVEPVYAMPLPCRIFDEDKYCPNVNCPHIKWNKNLVDLTAELKAAKHGRNQAILDLFHLKEKVADIKEYRRLKKLKQQQSKELLHLCCAYDLAKKMISHVHETDEIHVRPTMWGTETTPCFFINSNLIDYDADDEVEVQFNCPHYHTDMPCHFPCRHNAANREYIETRDKRDALQKEYDETTALFDAARRKLWGRSK